MMRVYFNGVALDNVAPVFIEDIIVSPISFEVEARKKAVMPGSNIVRIATGSRTVQVLFALLEKDTEDRINYFQRITEWAMTDTEGELVIPSKQGVYLSCVCTGLPEPSMRHWEESKLSLTFTTFDNPYWTSSAERHVDCGTQFSIAGSALPLMKIKKNRSSSASNQAYSDGTDTMTFTTVPSGLMTIDLNKQTADVGGTSIMQYYSYTATGANFIVPKTGIQTITGNGTVYYRERWL